MTRYTKTPSGKYIQRKPDRLRLYLSQHTAPVPAPWLATAHPEPQTQQPGTSSDRPYRTDTFDSGKLAGVELTVIGAGSMGSHMARQLGPARALLNVMDDKTVQAKHTEGGRTAYTPDQIGQRKVEALRSIVERDYPGTKVIPYPYKTSDIPDVELQQIFARSSVVVMAMDDPPEILRNAKLIYPLTELVQVAAHGGAVSGHIVLSSPFATPCLACTLNISGASDIHRLDSEPANSWDIIAIAQLAARMVVDIIYSKVTGQPITRWDTSKNLIYIANTKQELSPDGPGLHHEGSTRRPDCPICGRHRNLF